MKLFRKTYLWWFRKNEWIVIEEKLIGRRPSAPFIENCAMCDLILKIFFHPEGYKIKRQYIR